MKVHETSIPGVKIIVPERIRDERGYFCETYQADRYREAGIGTVFVQDNECLSGKGVLRGLHWQAPPHTQAKLVRVIRGAVWDVAVDIRQGSPTFGQHVAAELSEENGVQLFLPRGIAHGYLVLREGTVFSYKCDAVYAPEAERGLRFDDPALGIAWPNPGRTLLLSEKDLRHPGIADIEPWVG